MTSSEPSNIDSRMDPEDLAVWRGCFAAAESAPVSDALRAMYTDLDAAVTKRGPTCWVSGKCCNFNAYGHRLYVTALEIAWFLQQADEPGEIDLTGPCVYQREGMCSVHAIRPLGCRAFFCQEGTQQWQNELYEDFQKRLRAMHDAHDVPYRYMEWRAGLAEARQVT